MVAEGETRTMKGWIIYGAALNEGREMFLLGDNTRFSEWLANANLPFVEPHDRAAAMWAAGNPEEYREMGTQDTRVNLGTLVDGSLSNQQE